MSVMVSIPQDELDALRTRLREQAEELAEWRRIPAAAGESEEQLERIYQVRTWLGTDPGATRLLLALLANPGRVLTRERLHDIVAYGEDTQRKIVDVRLCKLRKALKAVDVDIQTVWGIGLRLDAEDAARLEALLRGRP